MIRTASFKRRGFNFVELEKWRRRSEVKHVFSVTFTQTRCRVVYK